MPVIEHTTCVACEAALPDVGGLREAHPPTDATAHVWHYIGKRERVRVARVWTGYPMAAMAEGDSDHIAVRCHPLHGGRAWIACLCDFRERFARNADDAR